MARIYYWSETGHIYGVHPDGAGVAVPEGVASIDVPEASTAIAWPGGSERTARVVEGVLVVREDLPPDGPAFIKAVMAEAFLDDPVRIDAVWKLCPVWWPAAKEANWPLVQALTTLALSRQDITQDEYDAIAAAAAAYRIPVTL